jgi:hypothetical protein
MKLLNIANKCYAKQVDKSKTRKLQPFEETNVTRFWPRGYNFRVLLLHNQRSEQAEIWVMLVSQVRKMYQI